MVKLLVAIDGSAPGTLAFEEAKKRALAEKGTEILLVYVAPKLQYLYGVDEDKITLEEKLDREAREKGTLTLTPYQKILTDAGIHAESRVHSGVPGDVIVEEAERNNIDIIYVGNRGLGTLKRLVLGSVSSYLVQYAHCSVFVAKDKNSPQNQFLFQSAH